MKDKQTFMMKGSFALLLFMIIGYIVKFYPEMLVGFDQPIQTAIRGDLPETLTLLFRAITHLIDIPVIISWVLIVAFIFYRKQWKMESYLMLGNLTLAGILIVTFKNIYQRPRPEILHLVEEKGFSFPSGHSLAVTIMVGTLIVILSQRIKNTVWRKIVQILLSLYIFSVLVSRIYLGVHYPSDVIASLCVGLGVLFMEFPFYDKLRFQWRFKGKQKEELPLLEEIKMEVNIKDLHPTQLYLSEKKLQNIQMLYQSVELINVDPISVLAFGDYLLITDGHHRAYQALLIGQNTISAEWDRDGGDELYQLYAQACEKRRICSVLDLKNHILPQDEYEAKWYNWCDGFNQAAELVLGLENDDKNHSDR